jgi:hypothetical protein
MGAAASQALWERFDGALQTAFAPITAQRAAIDENRRRNLAARLALLDALDAQPGPDASGAQAEGGPAWKDLLHMLNTFQLEWRKLGPLEHTVPADDRAGLQQRLRASIDRFEGPLQQARRVAADRRELLITQAQALQTGAGPRLSMTDAMRQLRDMQAQWQWQARQVPLARDDETALWMRFKSATDAFFARRDAEIAAREADFAAAHAARLAVLERLDSVREDAPASRRVLDEIDRDWRQAAELPRPDAEKLERRYREARTAAADRLRADAGERWRAVCGTLASALALQEAAERGAADAAELASRRAALAALPEPWERALHLRRTHVVPPAPLNPVEVDEWLLHLESALDLPATPESMAQRRALKLRALKDAMEGRTASQGRASEPSQRLVALLQQAGLNEAQGLRLHALVEALGRAEPGSWLAGGLRPAATARTA